MNICLRCVSIIQSTYIVKTQNVGLFLENIEYTCHKI